MGKTAAPGPAERLTALARTDGSLMNRPESLRLVTAPALVRRLGPAPSPGRHLSRGAAWRALFAPLEPRDLGPGAMQASAGGTPPREGVRRHSKGRREVRSAPLAGERYRR